MQIKAEHCPVRRARISAHEISNEAVLYDPRRKQVYALNESAYAVWQLCDGKTTIDRMAEELSLAAGESTTDLRRQVETLLKELQSLDLLHPDQHHFERIRHEVRIAFGKHHVLIHTDSTEIVEGITSIFEIMCVATGPAPAAEFGVYDMGHGFTVSGTRSMHVKEGLLHEALRALKHETVLAFIEARPDLIWLHAGAVTNGEHSIVFAGQWGAGKSTFVTTLYKQGWRYLSDDMVPFDPASGQLIPFPLTPAMRLSDAEVADRKNVALLPKIRTSLAPDRVSALPVTPSSLVFPRFDANGTTEIKRLPPAAAAVALIRNCQNMDHHGQTGIDALCRLAEELMAYAIQFRDPEVAVTNLLQTVRPLHG